MKVVESKTKSGYILNDVKEGEAFSFITNISKKYLVLNRYTQEIEPDKVFALSVLDLSTDKVSQIDKPNINCKIFIYDVEIHLSPRS